MLNKLFMAFILFLPMLGDAYYYQYCDRGWIEADYLYWKIKDSPEPVVLVINQPVSDGPSTPVLGGKNIKNKWRSGGRFACGYWLDEYKSIGGEVNGFFLSNSAKQMSVESDQVGFPRQRVPYFNVVTGTEASNPLSSPGKYKGLAVLKLYNNMQGVEANAIRNIFYSCRENIDLLVGFRYWHFDEYLSFLKDSPLIGNTPPTVFNTFDRFHAKNKFYGGQIGANWNYTRCSFFLNVKAKVAIGAMCQEAIINGRFKTNLLSPNFELVQSFEGGFFALPTNIGHHNTTRFAVLPEADVNIGYQLTDCICVKIGYTALCVSNVLWAGKMIDRNINPTQSATILVKPAPVLIGQPSPKVRFGTELFWAHGLNTGIEIRF